MAVNEEKEIRNLLAKGLEWDLHHHSVIYFPASGMSHLNFIALLRLSEKEKEREGQ